jgi:hypothetical protein
MKKFFAAILAVLYLGTSTGTTVYMHYCMGRVVEWGLRESNSSKCSKCGMKKKPEASKGCCRDEHKQVKIDKDQKASPGFQLSGIVLELVSVIYSDYVVSLLPALSENFQKSHDPPPGYWHPLYIIHCVFRI